MFSGKRVFVSGGAGVIGRELVRLLQQDGAKLFVGDLKRRPVDWSSDIRYRQGDLNTISPEELHDFAPQYFFHLAATFERSVESYDFWQENDRHNTRLSHHLMDALKDVQELEKVVFASSYLIYHPELYQFEQPADEPTRLREIDPVYPRNLCGMAKLHHEMELRFLSEHSLSRYQTVSARIYRVYGKDSRDIISRWIQALLKGETIQVYRKEGMFDYIYAGDVAEGLYRLALTNNQGIVNLGNGRARRVEEVLRVLNGHFPAMKMVEGDSDIPFEASEADMSRYEAWTGWRPSRNIEDAIPEMIEHYHNKVDSFAVEPHGKPAILISSVSKKVPLIRSVSQAAGKLGQSLSIVGGDSNADCIGRHFVDGFWLMPKLNEMSLEIFVSYCESKRIRAVVPTRDGELAYYAEHRAALAEHGIAVLVSEPAAVRVCLDKLDFYRFGAEAGFPVIPTANNITSVQAASYVVKERYGAGSIGLAINVSQEEALEHAMRLDNPIYQPYVAGKEVSADLYIDRKGSCKGVILRRRDVIIGGESQVTTTFRDSKLEELCATLGEAIGIYGHAVLQVIIDEHNGYHVVECNARLGGASKLSLESGLDSLYWFLLESQGVDLDDYPFLRSYKDKQLIRFAEDIIR